MDNGSKLIKHEIDVYKERLLNDPYYVIRSRIYSLKSLCGELGCTRQAIATWVKLGYLKPKYLGKKVIFLGADLIEFFNNEY